MVDMNMRNAYYAAVGWYGAFALVAAYLLVSFGETAPNSALAMILNLTGAIGIAVSSYRKRAWQAVAVNLFWMAVALSSFFLRT